MVHDDVEVFKVSPSLCSLFLIASSFRCLAECFRYSLILGQFFVRDSCSCESLVTTFLS